MDTDNLKQAQEAIEMLKQLNLPIADKQLENLASLEKEYLETEVLPSVLEDMRPKVNDLKTTFFMTIKYSEKEGLRLVRVESRKEKVKKEATVPGEVTSDGRYLGIDPESGKKVFVKVTAMGLLAQIGEINSPERPRLARLRRGMELEDVTLEDVLMVFKFPRNLGFFEGSDVAVGIGPYGPYVKHAGKYYNLSRNDDTNTITCERAIEIITTKRELKLGDDIVVFENDPNLRVINGRFGPFIKYNGNNYKIPKQYKPSLLTYEECMDIVSNPENKSQKWIPRNK